MRWLSVDPAARRSSARYGALLMALLAALAVLFVSGGGDGAAAETGGYSPYADPDKPVLSTVLAGDANVAAFRERFGLTEDEVGEVLAALRDEDRALAEEYADTERLLGAGRVPSDDEAKARVAASDYPERVGKIIAATKAEVEGVIGADSGGELAAWADERFSREAEVLAEGIPEEGVSSSKDSSRASSGGKTCRVWTTYYRGYTRYEVALPHRAVKFAGGYKVRIRTGKGTAEWAPVKEVGPWNIRDNYWQPPKLRDRWSSLPRCVPEAAAAYYWNFNRGKDEYGRTVTNPAGLDMTLAVAKRLHVAGQLQRYGKLRVYVHYPWAR